MSKRYVVKSVVAGVVGAALGSVVFAQGTTTDDDAYTLKGASSGASSATAGAATDLPKYGIGGSGGADAVIMTAATPERGAPIRLEGGVFVYPSVFAGLGRNDNVLGTKIKRKGSNYVNVAPSLVTEMKRRGDRYTAELNVNAMHYTGSSDDDYSNATAMVAGDNYFSTRARAGWQVGYVTGSDPRGSTDRPTSIHPDKWHAPTAQGRFIYGANEALGRVEFDALVQNKRYDNNRAYTQLADVDTRGIGGRFFYRVGSRSLMLAEVRDTKADYTSGLSADDNTERRYYVGYTWDATAATTGVVKVGRMTKDFDIAARPGFSGTSWEAKLRWLPRTYSAVDIESSKSTADPTGFGNFLINTNTSLTWNHKWTTSLTSRTFATIGKQDFAGTTRTDDLSSVGVAVEYDLLRWLSLGVDFAHTTNSSNDTAFDYKRNVMMFTLNGTL